MPSSTLRDMLRTAFLSTEGKTKRSAHTEDEFDTLNRLDEFVDELEKSPEQKRTAVAIYYDKAKRAFGTLRVDDVDVAFPDQLDDAYLRYSESSGSTRLVMVDLRDAFKRRRGWV